MILLRIHSVPSIFVLKEVWVLIRNYFFDLKPAHQHSVLPHIHQFASKKLRIILGRDQEELKIHTIFGGKSIKFL